MSKHGYGGVSPRFRKYFEHLRERSKASGPHDPGNSKQLALDLAEEAEMGEHEGPDWINVYIVLVGSPLDGMMVGPVYFDPDAAAEEVSRLKLANKFSSARYICRQVEFV